jgi:hypothetical protein
MGGAGGVITQSYGAKVAERHHTDGVEISENRLRVLRDYVRVLRGIQVGDLYGLRDIAHAHDRSELCRLPSEQGLNAAYELGARGEEYGRSTREVLGLRHEIVGYPLGKGPVVGKHYDLARPLWGIHAHDPEDLQLGGDYIVVAGTHDLIDCRNALCAVGHSSHRLGAPYPINLVEPKKPGSGEHIGIHPTVGAGRSADADLPNPRDLRRDRRHHEGTRVGAMSAGNVETGPT